MMRMFQLNTGFTHVNLDRAVESQVISALIAHSEQLVSFELLGELIFVLICQQM